MKAVKSFCENEVTSRLNNVIKKDKQINPTYMNDVIKSDFFYLINNYFEVEFNAVDVKIDVDDNNKYNISISASGDRIKMMQTIPRD